MLNRIQSFMLIFTAFIAAAPLLAAEAELPPLGEQEKIRFGWQQWNWFQEAGVSDEEFMQGLATIGVNVYVGNMDDENLIRLARQHGMRFYAGLATVSMNDIAHKLGARLAVHNTGLTGPEQQGRQRGEYVNGRRDVPCPLDPRPWREAVFKPALEQAKAGMLDGINLDLEAYGVYDFPCFGGECCYCDDCFGEFLEHKELDADIDRADRQPWLKEKGLIDDYLGRLRSRLIEMLRPMAAELRAARPGFGFSAYPEFDTDDLGSSWRMQALAMGLNAPEAPFIVINHAPYWENHRRPWWESYHSDYQKLGVKHVLGSWDGGLHGNHPEVEVDAATAMYEFAMGSDGFWRWGERNFDVNDWRTLAETHLRLRQVEVKLGEYILRGNPVPHFVTIVEETGNPMLESALIARTYESNGRYLVVVNNGNTDWPVQLRLRFPRVPESTWYLSDPIHDLNYAQADGTNAWDVAALDNGIVLPLAGRGELFLLLTPARDIPGGNRYGSVRSFELKPHRPRPEMGATPIVLSYDPIGMTEPELTTYSGETPARTIPVAAARGCIAATTARPATPTDILVISTSGWRWVWNGAANGDDAANGIAVDDAGNVIVVGSSEGAGGDADFVTVCYDPDGTERWSATWDGAGHRHDIATAVAVDAAGNIYVTGQSARGDDNGFDYATISYDSQGKKRWEALWNSPANQDDIPVAIAIGPNGSVVVTGRSANADGAGAKVTGFDFATVCYGPQGDQRWTALFNTPSNQDDIPAAMAVDPDGNIYLAGKSARGLRQPELGGYDYATLKYSPSGELLWHRNWNQAAANQDDEPAGLTVDADGNVYVAGKSARGGDRGFDYCILKYDSSGKFIWERTWDGAAHQDDMPAGVVVDGDGNSYMTGTSYRGENGFDITTVSYDPDGNERWHRSQGSAGQDEFARGIGIDDRGRPVVVGQYGGSMTTTTDLRSPQPGTQFRQVLRADYQKAGARTIVSQTGIAQTEMSRTPGRPTPPETRAAGPEHIVLTQSVAGGYLGAHTRNQTFVTAIAMADLAAGETSTLFKLQGFCREPVFSPDRRFVAASVYINGKGQIYLIDTGTGDAWNVSNNAFCDRSPCFSPDGEKIAFVSDRDSDWEIYAMNRDGSDPVRLTDSPGVDRAPAYAPDGRRLAFISNRDGDFDVYVMDADGNNAKLVKHRSGNEYEPTWSPDGEFIACTVQRGRNRMIFLERPDGSETVSLASGHTDITSICFSPDGTKMAAAFDEYYNSGVLVVDRESREVRKLVNIDMTYPYPEDWYLTGTASPRWLLKTFSGVSFSPDSQRLAYCSDQAGGADLFIGKAPITGGFQFFTIPVSGGEPTPVPDSFTTWPATSSWTPVAPAPDTQ